MQTVLARVDAGIISGFCVTIFVDTKEMNDAFRRKGLPLLKDPKEDPYAFCSQEISGNTLNKVTHWSELPEFSEIIQDNDAKEINKKH